MPRRATAAPAEPEETEETEELDLTAYATKPVTVVAEAYTEWIEQETGYKADERTVYLAMSLRRKFQHDPDSRERIAELREERNAAKPAKEKATPEPEEGEEPAQAKPARSRSKAAAPKPTPPATRRGAARPTAAAGTASRATTGRTRSKTAAGAAAPF
jgi:hypothetical protein